MDEGKGVLLFLLWSIAIGRGLPRLEGGAVTVAQTLRDHALQSPRLEGTSVGRSTEVELLEEAQRCGIAVIDNGLNVGDAQMLNACDGRSVTGKGAKEGGGRDGDRVAQADSRASGGSHTVPKESEDRIAGKALPPGGRLGNHNRQLGLKTPIRLDKGIDIANHA